MLKTIYLKYRVALAVAILSALLFVGTAQAHTRIVKGDYAFVLGWLDEPPVAGVKNAALVEVTTVKDNQPVTGAEAALTAQIQFGGKTRDLILRPLAGTPGTYVGDFIPTRRGTFMLQLSGTLNGQSIDLAGEIEEVGSSDSLAFPEPVNSDLQQALNDMRSAVNTAQLIGSAGLSVAVISLVLLVVTLVRRRS